MPEYRKHYCGFTLIELMIVLAIAGILAAIAYPSYINYVRNAQRSDAKAALFNTAQRMERYYTAHNSYPDLADQNSPQGYWTVNVDVPNGGQSYTLTAVKTGKGVTDSTCSGKMTLDQTGQRTPDDACWSSQE